MSETVTQKGKLELVKNIDGETTFDKKILQLIVGHNMGGEIPNYDTPLECLLDCMYLEYLVISGRLFKLVNLTKIDDDICEITDNLDGTFDFVTSYYNGGCDLGEALEEKLDALLEVKHATPLNLTRNGDMAVIDNFLTEFSELASWDGCETGDLAHSLIDLFEGASSYASEAFRNALHEEMTSLFRLLKFYKAQEEREERELVNESGVDNEDDVITVSIGDTVVTMPASKFDNLDNTSNHISIIINELKEAIELLEEQELQDSENGN